MRPPATGDWGRLPALHAPASRELVGRAGPWEIRRYAEGEQFSYFASRAFLHIQLWHPIREVSVLTPSRSTEGRFEIARGTRRARAGNWAGVIAALPDLELPCGVELAALTLWLVVRHEVASTRTATIASADG